MSRGTWELQSGRSSIFVYAAVTRCGPTFQRVRLTDDFVTSRQIRNSAHSSPTTPNTQRLRPWHVFGLGWFPFARRYLGSRYYFPFLGVLRCFSSPRWLPLAYLFSQGYCRFACSGFPHSDISGSQLVCSSPKLIAAYHVLHRRLMPRHPPSALSSLI